MIKNAKIALLLVLLFCITGCSEKLNFEEKDMQNISSFKEHNGMEILNISFSPDYKEMVLDVDLTSYFNEKPLSDSSAIKVAVKEAIQKGLNTSYYSKKQPKLIRIQHVSTEEVAMRNFKLLAIVDLTLPQPIVDEQREALREIKNTYGSDKIFVSFMSDFSTSETILLTDYVLQHYFVSRENSGKYLFRSIVEKRNEMIDPNTPFPTTNNQALLIFSDGMVYNEEDEPFDSKHYEYKAELDKVYPTLVKDTLSIYYVQMGNDWNGGSYEATTTLQRMCQNYDGLYQEQFDWHQMETDFKKIFDLVYCDYRLTLTNADKKVYRGDPHTIFLECYDNKYHTLLASDSLSYTLGSVYNPIIVNADNIFHTILQGVLLVVILLVVIYLTFQYIVPAIRYLCFLKRYVVTYKGKGMVIDNRLVGDSCYMCKDSFQESDQIVVKCNHTVHKSCWNENEYKCPEYGHRCREGSYYFNRRKLWDSKNAPQYMNRLLVGCLAALGGWILFVYGIQLIPHGILDGIAQKIYGADSVEINSNSTLLSYADQMRVIPHFGFCVGIFNILFFGLLSVTRGILSKRIGLILWFTVIGAICCWVFFAIECVIVLIVDITSYSYLIDWIPWVLSSTLILYLLARYTGGRLEKKSILISCAMGILSINIWYFLFIDSFADFRLILLLSFISYSVIIALCMSHLIFRSEHFFLSVSGSIKPIDIALYKWFRTSPNSAVSIGRSVDCNLQITWDVNGKVSPIQAEIKMQRGILKLYAIEDGVYVNGKPWPLGKGLRLYHGASFTIANTLFTYKENSIKKLF